VSTTKLTSVGDELEGNKVRGQSRKPLERLEPVVRPDDTIVHQWKASFDVRAQVQSALDDPTDEASRLCPSAVTFTDHEIVCDVALVSSRGKKYSTNVEPGSATHQTNVWSFPKQSCVRILTAHKSLDDGRSKRAIAG
jgi:hypothetical protein